MSIADPLPHLLSIDELAGHLGVTVRHIRRLIAERRIPYLKVGHFIRFNPAEIVFWLEESRPPRRSAEHDHPRPDVRKLRSAGPTAGAGTVSPGP